MKTRVDIISVLSSDSAEITKVQAKLNQWLTKCELKKYEIHTTSTHLIFNICRVVSVDVEKVEKVLEKV